MADRATPGKLRIHGFIPSSLTNGPGNRAVVWTQGCTLACPGCFNTATHSQKAGRLVPIRRLVEKILRLGDEIEGLTVSGGEPFLQWEAVGALIEAIRERSDFSVCLFTGYSWAELSGMWWTGSILRNVDVLVAGPYDRSRRCTLPMRGSENQTVHLLTGRYSAEEIERVPEAEVMISDSEVVITGLQPPVFQKRTGLS